MPSIFLPNSLFLNAVVLCGHSGGDHWDEKPMMSSCEAVVILLTQDFGPYFCILSSPVSLPFPLIFVSWNFNHPFTLLRVIT